MAVMLTPDQATNALEGIKMMLEADGYELGVGVDAGTLVLQVSATPEACAECLVPKELMTQMALAMLADQGLPVQPADVRLDYPVDLGQEIAGH